MTMMTLWSCSDELTLQQGGGEDLPFEPSMVLFSAGNAENTITRASIPYMDKEGRFVCKMYYHSKTGDKDTDPFDVALPNETKPGTQVTAWLEVNNKVGNCIYRSPDYPTEVTMNEFGEKAAQAFYWQNRLPHAFLAVADFNQLKTNTASNTTNGLTMPFDDYVREVTTNSSHTIVTSSVKYIFDDGTEFPDFWAMVAYFEEKIEKNPEYQPHHTLEDEENHVGKQDPELEADGYYYQWTGWMYHPTRHFFYNRQERVTVEKVKVKYYAKEYDLTKDDNVDEMSMSKQPDPIQALTLKTPEGATQEANRVKLFFKHQFSQILVNIKNSEDENDIPVASDDLLSVELLGVTRKGYVYVNLNEDGTVHPTDYEEVNSKTVPKEQWVEPYGTEFKMFERTDKLTDTEKELGYFKSYEAIAFGRLEGIRIRWKEAGADGVTHNVIFQIPDDDLKTLQSGVRYIYNLELRRGTLALIRTVIKDWTVDETVYTSNGTITN